MDRLAVRLVGLNMPARRRDDKAPAAQPSAKREDADRDDEGQPQGQQQTDHAATALRLWSAASAAAAPVS